MPAWYADVLDGVESAEPTYLACEDCGAATLPPRAVCPECGSSALREAPLSTSAEVVSYTEIGVTIPEFHGQTPYTVVLAEFPEGVSLTGRLSLPDAGDPGAAGDAGDAIEVGDPVEVGVQRLGAPDDENRPRRVITFTPA